VSPDPPPKRPAAVSSLACVLAVCLAGLLAACGNNADGAQDRYERAYLSGRDRVSASEFTRFRTEVASTAQPGLVARAELTRCAMQVASLDLAPCAGFEPLRSDAPEAERAYADFLEGKATPEQAKLLPEDYRGIAGGQGGGAALKGIKNPMSRLIAAAVLLRMQKADPEVLQIAVDTASEQGWRRAVLAWLGAQAMRAEQAGATEEAARLRRRMQLAVEER
jgi:hypothetical protein